MATEIISKRCGACKQTKQSTEFHKNRSRKDGHQTQCKICNSEYNKKYEKTEKAKTLRKLYHQSEKGKVVNRKASSRYYQTEKGKTMQRRYKQSEKGKANQKRYYFCHPNQTKAQHAVNHAIRDGKLQKVSSFKCTYCPNKAQQYHHHKGYEPKYYLDIEPVCVKCHIKLS